MFFYPFNFINQRNTQAVTIAAEKLKQRNLPMEQILDEEELMNDLKYANASQLVNHLNKEDMISLIKYAIREPEQDEPRIGYKFPFNSSEILSSENTYLLDKFFDDSNNNEEDKYEEYEVENKERNDELEIDESIEKQEEEVRMEDLIEVSKINEEISNVEEKLEKLDVNEVNEEKKIEVDLILNQNLNDENIIKSLEENVTENSKNNENKYEDNENKKSTEYFEQLPLTYEHNNQNEEISTKIEKVTRYLFFYKKESLYRMIYHLNRKAISDTLLKTLLIEASEVASDISIEYENQIKFELVEKIIESFNTEDEEKCDNICDLLSESLNNRKFAVLLLRNPLIIEKIQNLIQSNINTKYFKELLKISTKLCESFQKEIRIKIDKENGNSELQQMNLLDNYEKAFGSGEYEEMMPNKPLENFDLKDCKYLLQVLLNYITPVIKSYTNDENIVKMHTTYDKNVNVLGLRKLLEFEYVKLVYEIFCLTNENKIFEEDEGIIIYESFVNCLIENNFFNKAIDDFFIYEWNNSYQTQFENLMILIINRCDSNLIVEHIFKNVNFLDKIIEHSMNMRFFFNSGKYMNNGYFPHIIEICNSIVNSKNEKLNEIVLENNKWNTFYCTFVDPVRKRFQTGLKYDSNQDSNLFREEGTMDDNVTPLIDVDITTVTEKNFIESVRRQATLSLSQDNVDIIIVKPDYDDDKNYNFNQDSDLNEKFYDNHYWTSLNQFDSNQQDDILEELN